MKITLITLGHAFDTQEKAWIQTYLTRISNFATVDHRHVKDKFDLYKNRDDPKYARWIESLIPDATYLIALDQSGKNLSTEMLHQTFFDLELLHKHITFIIGGSYGFPQSILQKARSKISLGAMTLPHKLAFLILCEQLYRCYAIEKKIPYHHA